jgi:hypothetical protein
LLFNLRTRSPNDEWFLGPVVTVDSFPIVMPVSL